MRFYTQTHQYYCGIDLDARSMYVCILDQAGTNLVHRNMPADPQRFLDVITPFREDIVVAVECIFTWYRLADLCAREGVPFILGHALYMKAIHGGKAQNDKIDANKIAVLLRGGMLPQAYAYPPEMRSTHDLLRQYNLPALGKKIARKSNREGLAEHFDDLWVRRSMELDMALIDVYDELTALQREIVSATKAHDANSFISPAIGSRHRQDPGPSDSLRNP